MATSKYQHSPLLPQQIRLLRLLPGEFDAPLCGVLTNVSFDPDHKRVPRFKALSYVWGDQSNPELFDIVLEKGVQAAFKRTLRRLAIDTTTSKSLGKLAIGPNLASALRHLRHRRRSRLLWCDSICINQGDLQERAAQVSRMQDIFPGATRVMVWLGPEADNSDLALETLHYANSLLHPRGMEVSPGYFLLSTLSGRPTYEVLNEMPDSRERWQAIAKLLSRSWFRRLWTRQELALAKSETILIVGKKRILWRQMFNAVISIMVNGYLSPGLGDPVAFVRNTTNLNDIDEMRSNDYAVALMNSIKQCECSDDRDRVFATLSLASVNLRAGVRVDYNLSVKDVYKSYFLSATEDSQDLNLMALCNSARGPSWVPDFQMMKADPDMLLTPSYVSARSLALSFHYLGGDRAEVSSVMCDTITTILGSIPLGYDFNQLRKSVANLAQGFLGASPEDWAPEALATFCETIVDGRCSERLGRFTCDLSLLDVAECVKAWVADDQSDEEPSVRILISGALVGRSIWGTQSGRPFLGPSNCQLGDLICTILSCSYTMALRSTNTSTYLVVGPGYHPAYAGGEELLGPLPPGWEQMLVSHPQGGIYIAFGKDGRQQNQDPRLVDVRLPDGWEEGVDRYDLPCWWPCGKEEEWTSYDPRMTPEELVKRGVKVEKIVLE